MHLQSHEWKLKITKPTQIVKSPEPITNTNHTSSNNFRKSKMSLDTILLVLSCVVWNWNLSPSLEARRKMKRNRKQNHLVLLYWWFLSDSVIAIDFLDPEYFFMKTIVWKQQPFMKTKQQFDIFFLDGRTFSFRRFPIANYKSRSIVCNFNNNRPQLS